MQQRIHKCLFAKMWFWSICGICRHHHQWIWAPPAPARLESQSLFWTGSNLFSTTHLPAASTTHPLCEHGWGDRDLGPAPLPPHLTPPLHGHRYHRTGTCGSITWCPWQEGIQMLIVITKPKEVPRVHLHPLQSCFPFEQRGLIRVLCCHPHGCASSMSLPSARPPVPK